MTPTGPPASAVLAFTGLLLTVGLSALDAAQEQSAPSRADLHWLRIHRDGRIEAATGEVPFDDEARGDLRELWVWSPDVAPQKVPATQLEGFEPRAARNRFEIEVLRRSRRTSPEPRVVAAPTEMWFEVPEALLPAWPVPREGRLSVPWTRGERWRARYLEPGTGSWWQELGPGENAAQLVARPAVDLDLRVLGADDAPVAAWAWAMEAAAQGSSPQPLARYRADDGRLSIASLPDEPLALLVSAPDHLSSRLAGRPDALPGTLRLRTGAAISGRFLDTDRRPLPEVEVELEVFVADESGVWTRRRAVSDAGGSWRIAQVPPGKAWLGTRAPGLAPFERQVEVPEGGLDLGPIVLEPGRTLAVLLTDLQGQPLPTGSVEHDGEERAADGAGRVELSVALDRPARMRADAPGFLAVERTVRPPLPHQLQIQLAPAFLARGRLLRTSGEPVADGLVEIVEGARTTRRSLGVDGGFELELPVGKPTELTFLSPATEALRIEIAPGEAGETRDLGDLIAPAGLTVRARLLDAADGSPVVAARIWSPRPTATDPQAAWLAGDVLRATSGPTGELVLRGASVDRPLRLFIEASGFARRTLDAQPQPDLVELDLGDVELHGGSEVLVRTDDREGAVARIDLGNRWLELDMLQVPVVAGEATFRHVPPGPATVSVVAADDLLCETPAEITVDAGPLEVECRSETMRVSGTVLQGGEPAGPGRLSWLPPALDTPSSIHRTQTPGGLVQSRVFGAGRPQVDVDVAVDGHFSTERLRPGSWTASFYTTAGSSSEPKEVELPRSDEAHVVLDFPSRTLEGVVVDVEDAPVPGALVRELSKGATVISDDDGRFRFAGIRPGLHYLRARQGGARSAAVAVDVPADEEPEPVTLVLGTDDGDGKLEIAVVDGDAGVAGALVLLETDDRRQQILTTGSAGLATARLDPPLPSRLRAAAWAGGRWVLGRWTEWEEHNRPIVLAAAEAGVLAVTLDGDVAPLRLVSSTGWDVSWLLSRIGLRPMVGGDEAVLVAGLPPGSYEVAAGGATTVATVRAAELTEVELEPIGD